MKNFLRRMIVVSMLIALAALLSGCFLRLLFGTVAERDTDFGRVFVAEIGGQWGPMAICDFAEGNGPLVDCTYTFLDIEGDPPLEITITSSAELISQMGILGVFVDPLILQVPDGATTFTGTFDDGSGPQPIVITETNSFNVQPGTVVSAEAGQKFVILEFPPALLSELTSSGQLDGPFDFTFEFELPTLSSVDVKPMFAGNVEVGGQTFYVPLLPCVTDFSSIPAITIPVSSTQVNLMAQIVGLILQGGIPACDGEVYDFSAVVQAPTSTPTQTATLTPTVTPTTTSVPPTATATATLTRAPAARPVGGQVEAPSAVELLLPWLALLALMMGATILVVAFAGRLT